MKIKAYISIATFLAAGAVFSNADILKEWNGFSTSDYTNLGTVSVSPNSAGAIELKGSSNNDTRVQFDISSLNIDFSSNLYQFELSVSSWSNGNGPLISWGTESGAVTNAQKYGFGYSTAGSGSWAATQNGSNMGLTGASSMVLGKDSNSGTLTITIGTSGETRAINVVFTNTSGTSYTLMENVSMTFGTNETIKVLNLGGWTTTNASNSAATVSSMSISLIPEPSMFGLLAGLGALALAGTRRRRK